MKKIAFDVMGNDNGVQAAVEASLSFVKKHKDYHVILIGNKEEIDHHLHHSHPQIEIIDVKKEVDATAGALASRSDDNSMAVAVNLVKENKADAVLSSGDSGSYLSMATLQLKRIEGVKRPAFMPIFPTIIKNKKFIMLDCGANIDSTSEMMEQWASLGSIFSKEVLKVDNPKVGIINIGTEEKKGKEFHHEVFEFLRHKKNINFIGFIEPRELLNGIVDVAVVDGYGGNLILKAMEGSTLSLLSLIKREITSNFFYKIGAFFAKGAFNNVRKTLDYRNIGAAWIVGLNGLAIKAHGGADSVSYLGAFNQIATALESNALESFKKVVKHE